MSKSKLKTSTQLPGGKKIYTKEKKKVWFRSWQSEPLNLAYPLKYISEIEILNSSLGLPYTTGQELPFDLIFNFDPPDHAFYSRLVPTFGTPRIDKNEQAIIMEGLGIPTPKQMSFLSVPMEPRISFGFEVDRHLQFPILVKSKSGARGLAQRIFSSQEEMYEFYEKISGYKNLDVADTYLADLKVKAEGFNHIADISNNRYFFQEFLDFRSEYRVLAFNTEQLDLMIVKRHVEVDPILGFPQANLAPGKKNEATYLSSITSVEGREVSNAIVNYSKLLLTELKTPWLSLDFAIDRQGRVFVLEFQMQAGIQSFVKYQVYNLVKKSFLNCLKKYGV